MLRNLLEFLQKRAEARKQVEFARENNDEAGLASALRTLGEVERRTPFTRAAALRHYEEAVAVFREVNDPLKLAHTIRHLGLVHEDAGRLEEAEKYYDEALAIYREYETDDTLDYANAVRYPAAIKYRLGKSEESALLWEEANARYGVVGIVEGVAESAARLARLSLGRRDLRSASEWLERASTAGSKTDSLETHRFIAEVTAEFDRRKET